MRRARICHVIWAVSAAHGAPARRRKTLQEDVLRPREFSPADAERAVHTNKPWLDELTSKYVFQSRPEPPGMRAGEAFLVPHSYRDPAQIKPDRLRFERRLGAGGVNNVYSVSYHANAGAADGFDPEKAAQCMRLLPVAYRKARNAHVIGGELFLRITEGRPIHKKPTEATHKIRIWRERWVLLHCGSGNIYYFKDADAAIGVGVESVGWADLPKGGDAKGILALAGSSMPAIGQYDNVRGTPRAHAIEFTEAADGDTPPPTDQQWTWRDAPNIAPSMGVQDDGVVYVLKSMLVRNVPGHLDRATAAEVRRRPPGGAHARAAPAPTTRRASSPPAPPRFVTRPRLPACAGAASAQ